jgi:SAM-dependent methyltransferase
MSDSAGVWTRYWSGGRARAGAGCLPNAAGPVEGAQKRAWQAFARKLPRGGRVLDLGTGNGVVLGWLCEARRDLKGVGVDSAASLPPPPKGAVLKPGIAFERLPFADKSFDAATSQFGFEYAATTPAATELARVLRAGAPLLMIVHHEASPILAHNRSRAEALRWASEPERWLARATAFAGAGSGLPVPPLFREAPEEARRAFPAQPAAAEFALGLLQRLEAGRGSTPGEALALLRGLEAEAKDEISRIALLETAAMDEAGAAALADMLTRSGFAMDAPGLLPDPASGRPLAWLLSGRR